MQESGGEECASFDYFSYAAARQEEADEKEAKDWDAVSSSAYESLNSVTEYLLFELSALPRAPALVNEVLQAVMICLGEKDDYEWGHAVKMMRDPKFLQRLREFDPSTINASMLKKLKPLVEGADFTVEKISTKSSCAAYMIPWVLAVYKYGSDQARGSLRMQESGGEEGASFDYFSYAAARQEEAFEKEYQEDAGCGGK